MFITINASHSMIHDLFITLINIEMYIKAKHQKELDKQGLSLYWSVYTRDPSHFPDESDFRVSVATVRLAEALMIGKDYDDKASPVRIQTKRCDLAFKYWPSKGWVCVGPKGSYSIPELASLAFTQLKQ